MASIEEFTVRTYVRVLKERPAGYLGLTTWEYRAWSETAQGSTRVWESHLLGPVEVAKSFMGLDNLEDLDKEDSQELSEQFYTLLIDLLQEAHKDLLVE